ncbi:multidrug ABC transporter ATP-binding protein [Companilactobacillus sp. RD055328]|uniref:ABC transporter ATP-binding protein n=1 Tax=Companilactobacillus sp. RD055328 TaxID=2916634 RepID=UPI001FC7DB0B|nr:ABC transporter ATP-binding protein [Companilactobacillus sp. RD055328]GKQ42493.1 multidrug ABC transporter ATP-binding protein [Companilactobacillus sp. RD055328]
MTLEVKDLTGGYGPLSVLKNETFDVQKNEIVGLIGLNGAGKSTTIKHIIGLLKPRSGEILIDNLALADNVEEYRKKIAYVPEMPILYSELTLKEHIDLTIMAYDLDHDSTWDKAKILLEKFRLNNKLDWFPENFSKGMKQKVMIVCAFMRDASLFIIDEPFTGLDPIAVHDLIELVEEKKANGSSILMSTHNLATAEQYADRFVLINNGQIKIEGSIEQLRTSFEMPNASLDDIYMELTKEVIK